MAKKDRKTNKLRGSRTHGYGNAQKHRGAGSRGGRGLAGSKTQKWNKTSKFMKDHIGKKGFKRPKVLQEDIAFTNVGFISKNIGSLMAQGFAKEEAGAYSVDLAAAGYQKLLGSGKAQHKLNVKVASCSQKAREKVEGQGGSVETSNEEEFEEFTEAQPESGD